MSSNQVTYELSLKYNSAQKATEELLRLILYRIGIALDKIIVYEKSPYSSLLVYFKDFKKAHKIYQLLKNERIRNVNIKVRKILPKSWKKKGSEEFKPFKLTKTLFVAPQKDRKKFYGREKSTIFLSTGLAFGSGLHETTRFMANLIEEFASEEKSFLDIGTGSGILSLVALKNGIKKIRAIDISKDSVKIARTNLRINQFRPDGVNAINIDKLQARFSYDYVAANLITKDLILFQKRILSLVAKGGLLAISGISLENYSYLRKHFKNSSLKCVKVVKGKEWAAILFRKLS